MKFIVIISKKDKAGLNIAEELEKLGVDYVLIEKDSIYVDDADNFEELEKIKDADFLIFATRHKSEKGEKSLTIHAPGNFSLEKEKVKFGGRAGKVCQTSSLFLKFLFKILNQEAEKEHYNGNVSLEVTHHGPLIKKPCCFIEIGSCEDDWEDKNSGRIIARTIKTSIENFEDFKKENSEIETAIGIGGLHYCPNFNKIQLNSKYALSHIIPEYALPLKKEMIKEAVEKTQEKVKKVIIDWKGCGKSEEREKVISIIKELGFEVLRSDKKGE